MGLDDQARRLRMHVEQLACTIGERNVFCPTALQAAASYIEHEWEQQGYAVRRLAYDVSGVRCLNLEITRSGGARQREILLTGAQYDTVTGSPGANTTAREHTFPEQGCAGPRAVKAVGRILPTPSPNLSRSWNSSTRMRG